ncbi:MAG: LEPR-XLL domain-containing protein, partial [Magnetococcales bacterium]|nr:LEPR-XLL domain-containing protein [Magnetococcales bacterium]NGZ29337.1 LEPR-XLL domain-containing protein [Magnetococcales bacterium]
MATKNSASRPQRRRPTGKTTHPRPYQLEAMENRLLMSADSLGVAVILDDLHRQETMHPTVSPDQLDAALATQQATVQPDLCHTGDLTVQNGQTLSGNILVNGTLFNQGTVSPGHSPGIDTVDSYSQDANATLTVEIGGLTPGPGSSITNDGYDQLNIKDAAILDGNLNISLLDGFIPQVGQTFDILTWKSVSGNFDTISGLYGFGDGSTFFQLNQLSDRLQLEVVELDGFSFQSSSTSINTMLGMYFNDSYFPSLSLPTSVTGQGVLEVSSFLHISGNFSLGWAGTESVDVTYRNDALSLSGTMTTEVEMLTFGVADAFGFIGYVGDGENYLSVADPGPTLETNEINSSAVGLVLKDVDLGMALAIPNSLDDYLLLGSMSAGRLTVGDAQIVGIEGLDLTSQGIEVQFNGDDGLLVSSAIDWKGSFAKEGGYAIETGGDKVTLDFAPQEYIGVYIDKATLKVDD